jgi:hypothetical protein
MTDNMGSMSKEQIEAFFDYIMEERGYGYTLQWTDDVSICMRSAKKILLNTRFIGQYPWLVKEAVLHEIAHINNEDRFHSERFYGSYIVLLKQFVLGSAATPKTTEKQQKRGPSTIWKGEEVQARLDDLMSKEKELAHYKRALELACERITRSEACPYESNVLTKQTCEKCKTEDREVEAQCWQYYFINKSKEGEG